MLPEEAAIHFLRTAVGPLTGLEDAPNRTAISPTRVAFAEGRTLQNSAPSNKVSQDLIWIKGFEFQDYLIQGLQEGFRIGFEGPRFFRESYNLKSCGELPQVISEKIAAELALGRIQGPFDKPPFPNLQVSPIGCVPKKKTGEYRIIHHLSYPEGGSVNDFICEELSTVKYCKFDDAVALVLELGPGCLMCKTDIEAAYRILARPWVDRFQMAVKILLWHLSNDGASECGGYFHTFQFWFKVDSAEQTGH